MFSKAIKEIASSSKFFSQALKRQIHTNVTFLTDFEGSKAFFNSVKGNSVINYNSDKGLFFQPKMAKNGCFIYGGDVTDRGKHDQEITELLVDFKQRHPQQVILIPGNREFTKLRFKQELAFLATTSPNGITGTYLQLAQLAAIVPDTNILTVHGALTAYNMGRIPGSNTRIGNVHQWVDQLNQWYRQELNHWVNVSPTTNMDSGYSKLDIFALPGKNKPKSIVIASMLDKAGSFTTPDPEVIAYLTKNKIQLVLSDHQPCGDYPALLNGEQSVYFINTDTGRSNTKETDSDDTLGIAKHQLE